VNVLKYNSVNHLKVPQAQYRPKGAPKKTIHCSNVIIDTHLSWSTLLS